MVLNHLLDVWCPWDGDLEASFHGWKVWHYLQEGTLVFTSPWNVQNKTMLFPFQFSLFGNIFLPFIVDLRVQITNRMRLSISFSLHLFYLGTLTFFSPYSSFFSFHVIPSCSVIGYLQHEDQLALFCYLQYVTLIAWVYFFPHRWLTRFKRKLLRADQVCT